MSKITDSARGEDCTIRLLPHCNRNNETTVFCHLNGIRLGHGTAKKVADIHGAYGCSSCHDVVDGKVKSQHYTTEEIKIAFYEASHETQNKLLAKGLIKLC